MEFQEKENHQCSFCDFKSARESKLEDHIRVHTREKPFLCDHCKREFSTKKGLNGHKLRVHKGVKKVHENKYKCFFCPYATHHKCIWEAHTQGHLGERSFSCQHPGCQYAAKTPSCLSLHNINKHKNERKFLCNFPNCEYRAKSMAVLKGHSVTHSGYRPFVCDFAGCSYRAKIKKSLQTHKQGVHNNGYKPFACSVCNYCTTAKYILSQHELTHSEKKSLQCKSSGCVFSCKTKQSLALHVRNRHADKKFKCDIEGCLSIAVSLGKLEEHKKRVHYDKAFKCPNCAYRAAIPAVLQRHIVSRHNASKRIPCPTKGCTFKAKHHQTLEKHLAYHKANLGCPMDGCGYVAHSSASLKRHMPLHDPTGRPFNCPLCTRYFCTNDALAQHLKSHTQEKPFQCPACNYGTVTKMSVIYHMRAFHPTMMSKFDEESICDHCNVNFGCNVGLAMHRMKLETAVIVVTRLQLKI